MADQVDEIKQKTDIVSLVSEYVELKKAGRNFRGLCPFHSEKTPSFMVSPELQIYKCFGCNESGDSYSFLQKHEGMDFPEALKFLADRAGVKLKQTTLRRSGEKERLYEINSHAARFYNYILINHRAGKEALDYLVKKRELSAESIKTFQLGFSPNVPFASRKYLVEKKKFSRGELVKAGITYEARGKTFDRMRGRVIFPLMDHRGNTIGFAGRLLPSNKKKELAKYINSPETPVYHKSSVLYGLNVTKSAIKEKKRAIIVEGELDVISSWQRGVKNVVATKGTAITEGQVRLLTRFTKDAVLALDTDLAGNVAARRGITIAQNQGLTVKVARLEKYKDPDEAVRKDPKMFINAIKEAVEVWDFIIDSIFSKYKTLTGETKSKISREVVPVLVSIDDKIVQAHYVKIVAGKLSVPIEAVSEQMALLKKGEKEVAVINEFTPSKRGRRDLLEERLLALAFQTDPKELLKRGINPLIQEALPKRIFSQFKKYAKTKKKFKLASFSKSLPAELIEGFNEIVLKDIEGLTDDPEVLAKELALVKNELKILNVKKELGLLASEIKKLEKEGKIRGLRAKEKAFSELTSKLSELESEENEGIIL